MRIFYKTLPLFIILLSTSCATIVSGSRQEVAIMSEPSSAKVFINEIEIGDTPVQKNLRRNQEYDIRLELEGYETYEIRLEKQFNAWYIGNLGFGGLIGIIVDPITGAIYKLKPQEIDGVTKNGTIHRMEGGNLFITISLDNDARAEKIGQLEKY